MKIVVKTAPTSDPVTLQEAKDHLRVTHNLEDAYITSLIKVARDKFEKDTDRILTDTTFELYLDKLQYNKEFAADIILFKCPVIEVSGISVLADDSTEEYTVVNGNTYKVDRYSEPSRILFNEAPTYGTQMNAIRVTFKAGYTTVPEQAKHAMKLLIGHFYESRQMFEIGHIIQETPYAYQFLIEQFKYTL